MNNELSHWKNRCMSVEKKVEEMEQKVEKMEESTTEVSIAAPSEETEDLRSMLRMLHEDIQCVNNGFSNLNTKSSDLFKSLKNDINDLKERHNKEISDLKLRHEEYKHESKQYSMLNDALIHGFTRLPNLQGPAFIFSVCVHHNFDTY